MKSVCIFCGSSFGTDPAYEAAAKATAKALVDAGLTVVYGGAKVGLMGVVAETALAAGGKVIGVMPDALKEKEIHHQGLSELYVVKSMHERKALMAEKSDGFIALPGGAGTLEELFEVWTWGQLGFHAKPLGFLNVNGFYDGLLRFLDHATGQGFMKPDMRQIAQAASTPEELLRLFASYKPPETAKWISKSET
ncbi:TIGR00730 family Rossman fold protein [Roseibium sp.]|uniref:LOG family protein n=1 Tax=Roseibium sp. TaxID=1936156 RepID=UPI003A983089